MRLRQAGVAPDARVGIFADRCPELFVGILGVLKAGGAYLCLDPSYPQERLLQIWEDLAAPVLLCQRRYAHALPPAGARVMILDAEDAPGPAPAATEKPAARAKPDNLAYVIFTSGSTGRPKGILLAHRGLVNMIEASNRSLNLKPGDRLLQFAALGFDASVWEIFMALTSGATLVILGASDRFLAAALYKILEEREVTVALLPPSLMAVMPPEGLTKLRAVISVGERLTSEVARRWSVGRRLLNGYGPAEATITASMFEAAADAEYPLLGPPIGRPLQNVHLYVLAPDLSPVPVGQTGEIFVGGLGVARGYLNRPEMDREKFIPDPFAGEAGARMYRTGDSGRLLPDGNFEFLGRLDRQIKLMGYRVELEEVEAALRCHPDVSEAAVLVREDRPGRPRLVAFFLPARSPAPSFESLRGHMEKKLPKYMIPDAYIALEQLPLTPNGKLDRNALASRALA